MRAARAGALAPGLADRARRSPVALAAFAVCAPIARSPSPSPPCGRGASSSPAGVFLRYAAIGVARAARRARPRPRAGAPRLRGSRPDLHQARPDHRLVARPVPRGLLPRVPEVASTACARSPSPRCERIAARASCARAPTSSSPRSMPSRSPRPRSRRCTPPRLHDGSEVVVKIQRPHIERRVAADMRILRFGARLLSLVPTRRAGQPRRHHRRLRRAPSTRSSTSAARPRTWTSSTASWRSSATATCAPRASSTRSPRRRVITMERFYGVRVDDVDAMRARAVDAEAQAGPRPARLVPVA